MTRPFFTIGFAMAFSLIVCAFVGLDVGLIFCAVSFVSFLISLIFKNKAKLISVVLAALTIGSFVYCITYENQVKPLTALDGDTKQITSTVIDKSDNFYKLKVNSFNEPFKLILYSKDSIEVDYYDEITANVVFFNEENNSNFGEGYYIQSSLKNIIKVKENDDKPIIYYFKHARDFIKDTIKTNLPKEEGNVLTAMLLGDKSMLSSDVKADFSGIGIYHLFAVSGLHLSVLSSFVYRLLNKFKLSRISISVLSIIFVLSYMALTGFAFSVVRAGIIMIIFLSGRAFLRQADSLNSLGLAMIIVLLITPMAIFDVSFLLTVCANLGVITLGNYLINSCKETYKKYRIYRFLKTPLNTFAISLSVWVFTLPIMFIFFAEIVLISPLTNIIFVPLATVALITGMLSSVFFFAKFIMMPLAFVSGITIKLMIFLAEKINQFSINPLVIGQKYLLLWLCGTLFLIGISLIFGKKKNRLAFVAVLSIFVLIFSSTANYFINKDYLNLYILDVGNDLSAVAVYKDKSIVIGVSGKDATYKISKSLKNNRINHIDLLVVPEFSNQAANVKYLQNIYNIDNLLVPTENIEYINTSDNLIINSNISLDLGSNLSVEYTYTDFYVMVKIKYGESDIIIYPKLTDEKQSNTADIIVTKNKVLKDNYGKINIISGNKYTLAESQKLNENGINSVATGGCNSLLLKVDDKGNYNIKRVQY